VELHAVEPFSVDGNPARRSLARDLGPLLGRLPKLVISISRSSLRKNRRKVLSASLLRNRLYHNRRLVLDTFALPQRRLLACVLKYGATRQHTESLLWFSHPDSSRPAGSRTVLALQDGRTIGGHKHPSWLSTYSETGHLSRIDFYILAVVRISTIKTGKARRCIWTIVEAGGTMPE